MSKEIIKLRKKINSYLGQVLHFSRIEPKNFEEIKRFEELAQNAIQKLELIEVNINPILSLKAKIQLIEIIENKDYDYLDRFILDEITIDRIKKKGGNLVLVKDNFRLTVDDYIINKIHKV